MTWWGLTIADDGEAGDIAVINEDPSFVVQEKPSQRPIILLSSSRGDPKLMSTVKEFDRAGGFCRLVFKPVGPHRLYAALKLCLHAVQISHAPTPQLSRLHDLEQPQEHSSDSNEGLYTTTSLARRYSEEKAHSRAMTYTRPLLGPRANTVHPLSSWTDFIDSVQSEPEENSGGLESPVSHSPSSPTVSVGSGGSLLKASVGTLEKKAVIRVLVVEDNAILRNLL